MARFDDLFSAGEYERAFKVADNPLDRYYAAIKSGNEDEALFWAGEAFAKHPQSSSAREALDNMLELMKYREKQNQKPEYFPPAAEDDGQYNLDISVKPGGVIHAKPRVLPQNPITNYLDAVDKKGKPDNDLIFMELLKKMGRS